MISPANPSDGAHPEYTARAQAAERREPADARSDAPTGPPPWEPLWKDLQELRRYAVYYVTAQADASKAKIRKAVITAVLGVLGALAGSVVVIMCVVLLMLGISNGISALLGGRDWAGELITGVGILTLIALGAVMAANRVKSSAKKKTLDKYAAVRREQQVAFDRRAAQRTSEAGWQEVPSPR
jgi:hypothetical protein